MKPKLIRYLNDGEVIDPESGKQFGLYEYKGNVVILYDYPELPSAGPELGSIVTE